MDIRQRVLRCRAIDKMRENEAYSKKLGLENCSTFHGERIYNVKQEERE